MLHLGYEQINTNTFDKTFRKVLVIVLDVSNCFCKSVNKWKM